MQIDLLGLLFAIALFRMAMLTSLPAERKSALLSSRWAWADGMSRPV